MDVLVSVMTTVQHHDNSKGTLKWNKDCLFYMMQLPVTFKTSKPKIIWDKRIACHLKSRVDAFVTTKLLLPSHAFHVGPVGPACQGLLICASFSRKRAWVRRFKPGLGLQMLCFEGVRLRMAALR